jgi:hypothetical protein
MLTQVCHWKPWCSREMNPHHDVGDGVIAALTPIRGRCVGKQWGIAEFAPAKRCSCWRLVIGLIAALPTQNGVVFDQPAVGGDDAQRLGHRCEVVGELVVEMLAAAGARHRDAVVRGEGRVLILGRRGGRIGGHWRQGPGLSAALGAIPAGGVDTDASQVRAALIWVTLAPVRAVIDGHR